jgi:AcrR family transcriptional regulator
MSPDDFVLSPRAQSTRERLLEAGMELFAESGYSSRLADIVEHAGLTTGAFYRYFDGKRALYSTLFDRYEEALRSALDSAVTLESAFARWLVVSDEHRGVVTAGAELVRQDEAARASQHKLRAGCSQLLIDAAAPIVALDRPASLLLVDVLFQYALTNARAWIPLREPALIAAQLMRLVTHGLYGT